jgi:hypothetical protein
MNNKNYKTLPIGTIFTYNGNKYKVCKDDKSLICFECAFNGRDCDNLNHIRGFCSSTYRTDHIGVYYKQINNETMNKDNDIKENVVIPIFNEDNSLSDIKIECPKGYIIDIKNTDLSKRIIRFKKDNITLEDIYEYQGKDTFITNVVNNNKLTYNKIAAIATLMDIANYYNKGWKPNWNNSEELKYHIVFDFYYNIYRVKDWTKMSNNIIYFAHQEDAQSVIDNPNFRDILDKIYKD